MQRLMATISQKSCMYMYHVFFPNFDLETAATLPSHCRLPNVTAAATNKAAGFNLTERGNFES